MNKNPFSIYDFLGYLFPGFVAITLIIYVILLGKDHPIEDYFSISEFVRLYEHNFAEFKWESAAIVLVLSYIAGHVIGYLSSIIVEYFTNRLFTYPSYYLLHSINCNRNLFFEYFNGEITKGVLVCRVIVALIVLPISIVLFIIARRLSLIYFIARPLDDYIINSIFVKLNKLSEKLGIDRPDVNKQVDYHRIIMHYVYLNVDNSQRKLDNYVAMYGFLRALTLIACSFFNYLLVKELYTVYNFLINGVGSSVDWKAILILIGIFLLSNVLYMAFVKFYRRFTVENYMALLVDKNLQQE